MAFCAEIWQQKTLRFPLEVAAFSLYTDDYMKAYSDVLTETSTEIAPWYVIPADNKWFMRYAVGQIICERMEKLDLHYPQLSKETLERLEECKKNVSDINF